MNESINQLFRRSKNSVAHNKNAEFNQRKISGVVVAADL